MNGNTGIVPKLRFPEFRDAGEWNEKELTKFTACGLSNGVFNDPKKVGTGYKLINVLDMYIDTVIDEKKLNLIELSKDEFIKNKVETGDIFFTRSSLVKSGIAYSNIYLGNSNDITFDGHLIRFRPNKIILSPIFANYLLRTYRVRRQLVARGKTATMTTIGQTDVSSIKLSIPNLDEQQKISDCLSSLDELITVQTQKIDGLKTHKKGLMQQLFPAEGETLPKLRFPEFRDAGEWEMGLLGDKDISIFVKERMPFEQLTLDDYVSTENLLPDYDGIKKASKLPPTGSCTRYKKGDVLISNIRPYLKKVWISNRDGGSSNDVIVIRAKSKIRDCFLAFLLKNDEFISYVMKGVKGVKMPRGDISLMKEYLVAFPVHEEQQKIADCLSSIDELITAQTKKLDALKTHKKGLMQQLFPSTDEVAG